MKIAINDVEYVSKLYIKFYLKRLKNEFLMNIFLGLGFLLYTLYIAHHAFASNTYARRISLGIVDGPCKMFSAHIKQEPAHTFRPQD